MKGVVVIDASLAVMWGMPETFTDRALALASEWAQEEIQPIAPSLILPEITNAFYKRVIRGETDLATAIEALHVVLDFGIEIREEPGLHAKAMELSHQMSRPNTYDCHYLALSEIHYCPLWTGDERFFNSLKRTFPRVKWIGKVQEELEDYDDLHSLREAKETEKDAPTIGMAELKKKIGRRTSQSRRR